MSPLRLTIGAPRDFTNTNWQRTPSDEDIAAVLREGKGAMPAFGEALTDPEVRAAVVAIRGFAEEAAIPELVDAVLERKDP